MNHDLLTPAEVAAAVESPRRLVLTIRETCTALGISLRHYYRLKHHGLWPIPEVDLHTSRPLYARIAVEEYVKRFMARPVGLPVNRSQQRRRA